MLLILFENYNTTTTITIQFGIFFFSECLLLKHVIILYEV